MAEAYISHRSRSKRDQAISRRVQQTSRDLPRSQASRSCDLFQFIGKQGQIPGSCASRSNGSTSIIYPGRRGKVKSYGKTMSRIQFPIPCHSIIKGRTIGRRDPRAVLRPIKCPRPRPPRVDPDVGVSRR